MEEVFVELINLIERGEKGALSTIVSSFGSLPMSKKAKMLAKSDGKIVGTVGGGCMEAEVWREAQTVMAEGTPRLQSFILTEKHAGEEGLNCGGSVEIFTEPISSEGSNEIFREIVKLKSERGYAALATLVSEDPKELRKMLVKRDGDTIGTLGSEELDRRIEEEAQSVVDEDTLKVLDIDIHQPDSDVTFRVFLEAILPDPTLYIFGGGHVSKAIGRIAKTAGFRLVIIDDRPFFANFERFPDADEVIVDEFDGVVEKLLIDDSSYLVAVTRGHQWDEKVIEQAVWTEARYIGMIGSTRKIALMWKKLEKRGIPKELLDAVHGPIGIDINADNPEEIAVSIVAELIKSRRQRGKPKHIRATKRKSSAKSVPIET